jgi:RNA polymerase sigma-70 factor (ECF subfamily)
MAGWLERVIGSAPGFERDLVDRYTERLLALAGRTLPERIRRRVDPEDVVQSVYRSFFQRLKEGRFSFDESGDVWRLLAALTFQKATEAARFHQRQRRDVRRESSLPSHASGVAGASEPPHRDPGPEDLAILVDYLEQLLARVPPSYRDIIVHRLNGDSIDEIAVKVKRSRRSVFRAMADLQKLAVSLLKPDRPHPEAKP